MKIFSLTCAIAILTLAASCSSDDSFQTTESRTLSKKDGDFEMNLKIADSLKEGDPVKPKTKD